MLKLWLTPEEARVKHSNEIYINEINNFRPLTVGINDISMIRHKYIKVRLKNCDLPYVFVLENQEKYFLETYGITHDGL